jgi:tetratricopeptide (TPR) repeat protein
VRASLEIVEAVKTVSAVPPLAVRIGVATGTVVVGGASQAANADAKLAVGETPNLAARLQELAGPNETVIALTTRRLVGDTFDLTDLGGHELKGIAEPVRAWRAVRVRDAASRFEASHGEQLTPLVGRGQEIGLLLDRQQLARESEGQVVLLSGEPGIGKSRILNELRQRLKEQGVQALRFQCSPYHVNHAFWPSIDHLERTLKYARDDTPDSKLDKLEAFVVEESGLAPSDVRFVARILSLPDARYEPLAPIPLTPQKHKEETLRTLVDLVDAASRERASVVLFEDLHWADPTTLEMLDLLIERVKDLPLLVVLTHRPPAMTDPPSRREEFKSRLVSWVNREHVSAIGVTGLTRGQCTTMVSRIGGATAFPKELVEEILNKTDGVPLFVEELTKSILESDDFRIAGDRYEFRGRSRTFSVPTTLEASLMARLDRHKGAREIAQIGAAIGREFAYKLIAAVASLPKAELNEALERLTALRLAFRREPPSGAIYSFKHALVQDTAYESLLKSSRPRLHAEIARAIEELYPNTKVSEPQVLAKHYTLAGLFQQGAAYWLAAGQKAMSSWALTEAIAHLQEGVKAIGNAPASEARDKTELETRVLLATAWLAYLGWSAPQVPVVLTPALPLAKAVRQPRLLGTLLWGLWVQLMAVGPAKESLERAEDLLRAGQELADEELQLKGHMALMVNNFWLGNPSVVVEHARTIMKTYVEERHGDIVKSVNHDPKTLAGIYLPLALWMLGYPDQAVALLPERNAHAERIRHPFDTGFVLTLGTWAFHYRREPEKVYAFSQAIQDLARESGMPFLSGVLGPFLSAGISLVQMGRLPEAIETLQTGIRMWESAGLRLVTPYVRARLGEALALSGDIEGGLSELEATLAQIYTDGWEERSHLAEILRLKGWMLSRKGDVDGAEENYLKSLEWARKQEAKSWELRTATSLARLWQGQGKRKEAYDLLAPVYGWFTEGLDTNDLLEAKELLEELNR